MYRKCSTEESARRQQQLEQCLLELMKTEAYSHITIGAICDRAGVSRKSFYRYFATKDGCLHALVDQLIIDAASFYMQDTDAQQTIHQIFERFFIYWQQHSDLVDALYKNEIIGCLVERMMLYLTEEDLRVRYRLNLDDGCYYERILFVITGTIGLVIYRHQTGYQKSASQMADILDELVRQT